MAQKLSQGETIALIHHYGRMLSGAHGGLGGASRSEVIEWAHRAAALANTLPRKNGQYLRDDD